MEQTAGPFIAAVPYDGDILTKSWISIDIADRIPVFTCCQSVRSYMYVCVYIYIYTHTHTFFFMA